jgi:NitT/TauT family transport system substrate-binding protein
MVAVLAALGLAACSSTPDRAAEEASPQPPVSASEPAAPPSTDAPATTTAPTPADAPGVDCPGVTRLTLALPGTSAPRFAGYYAALQRGYYTDACLDVAIITAESAPEALGTLAQGAADVIVSPLAEGLRARESGSAVANIAQIFQRSGTIQVSFASTGITSATDFRGKRVGLGSTGGWEVIAATSKAGLDPVADTNLTSGGGIDALLRGEVDAAATQTYDGYQRLLGQPMPASGSPMTPGDLSTISYESDGLGMLPDGLWASSDATTDSARADALQRFVTASLHGWIDCRDDAASCAGLPDLSPGGDTELGTRMVQAVNALVWPSPLGVGVLDPVTRDRTVQVALVTKDLEGGRLITQSPDDQSYVGTFAAEANAQLSAQGLNVTG